MGLEEAEVEWMGHCHTKCLESPLGSMTQATSLSHHVLILKMEMVTFIPQRHEALSP